jgi:ABC-type branched-subunit amino acid transport system substrate-binding protein
MLARGIAISLVLAPVLVATAACNVLTDVRTCATNDDCDEGFTCSSAGRFCERSPIVLGYLGLPPGESGQASIDGDSAVILAAELVNEGGGILGRRVEVSLKRDRPLEDAKRALADLDAVGAIGVVGPQNSTTALELQPLAAERRLVLISPGATSPDLSTNEPETDRYFFRTTGTPRTGEAIALARFAREKVGNAPRCSSVFIFGSTNAYAVGYEPAFREVYGKLGGCIADAVVVSPTVAASYESERARLRESKADCALLLPPGEVGLRIVSDERVAKASGQPSADVTWLASSGIAGLPTAQLDALTAGVPIGDDIHASNFAELPTPEIEWLRNTFNARFGRDPEAPLGPIVASTFDAALITLLAVERAGTSQDRAAIRDGLWSLGSSTSEHATFPPARVPDILAALRRRRSEPCGAGFLEVPCEVHLQGTSSDLVFDPFGTAKPASAVFVRKNGATAMLGLCTKTEYDAFEASKPEPKDCR